MEIKIACHTPGAKGAIVTKVEQVGGWGHVYSLEVTPWQFGGTQELEPWKPGVHLFTIGMTHLLLDSNTLATVVVPPQLKAPIMFSENAVQKMLTISQRRTRTVPRARPSVHAEIRWGGPHFSSKYHSFPSGHVGASALLASLSRF